MLEMNFMSILSILNIAKYILTHLHFWSFCPQIQNFAEQLKDAAQKAHTLKPVPGKANGVLVLQQPIYVEAYVGAMSFLGNQNKLGYCMARGSVGF